MLLRLALLIQEQLKVLTRRARGRAEVARRHGRGAQVGDAVQRFVQRGDDARVVQHVVRAAGALDGFFLAQHVGPARVDQHQLVKAHDLERARRRAHVAGMAGLNQDESGFQNKSKAGIRVLPPVFIQVQGHTDLNHGLVS